MDEGTVPAPAPTVCNEMGGDFEAGAVVETHLRTPSIMESPTKPLTSQSSVFFLWKPRKKQDGKSTAHPLEPPRASQR
ncbi:unnamed protein product [Fusarium venenatum]|uniref:Uncharacterized protein n=1 Tax=Fusarium venenatum TaxID=56646 RepID=A0A2L2TT10_9HYPO|nr:uncharacterized protein FVRRES_08654 [Fusarium venenatum]CEI68577.1 unnamed protein product [Fusarium venenatum]